MEAAAVATTNSTEPSRKGRSDKRAQTDMEVAAHTETTVVAIRNLSKEDMAVVPLVSVTESSKVVKDHETAEQHTQEQMVIQDSTKHQLLLDSVNPNSDHSLKTNRLDF